MEPDNKRLAHTLFCLGFRRSIFGLQNLLFVLRGCRSRIDELAYHLPQFSELLAGFQITPDLERQLLELPLADDPPTITKPYSNSSEQFLFTISPGYRWDDGEQKLFDSSGKEATAEQLYSFSMAWVMIAIRNCYHSSLPTQFFLAFDNWYPNRRVSSIPPGMDRDRIFEDLDWPQSISAACQGEKSFLQSLLLPIEVLLNIVRDFTPHPAALPAFAFVPSHSTALGIDKLSERDVLTSSWYFPRPAEQKTIKSFFSEGLKMQAGLSGEFYEKTLLAMAIWMGKDVEHILNLKCIGCDGLIKTDSPIGC